MWFYVFGSLKINQKIETCKNCKTKVKIFKPSIDKRYDKEFIISHDQKYLSSTIVSEASEILSLVKGYNDWNR